MTQLIVKDVAIHRIVWKRAFDIVFSLAALLITSPMMFLIALIVKCSSKGPILYAHKRVGRGGREFFCYKFRTMFIDSKDRLEEIFKKEPEKKREWEQSFKLQNDPRITPIGRFLRKTSLDEFPQFYNVLIGDLSVVGPRPVVAEELNKHYRGKAKKVLSIRPGITGLWQVSGRSELSYDKRVMMDEIYVARPSFLQDLKIIARTVRCMFETKGAW